jgi:putative phage-type endonuclease
MDQKTNEWLEWRRKGIGSSDAPIVMGSSPYMTRFQLWQVKTNTKVITQENMAIDRGNHWEPIARARYEISTGIEFEPQLFEKDFMLASLDGWNEEQKIILEIKVPGKEVFEMAKKGKVHPMYVWQLEHQLHVTGGKEVHFHCVQTDGKGAYDGRIIDEATVIYKSNPDLLVSLLSGEAEFWAMVQSKVPPQLSEDDVLDRYDTDSIERFSSLKSWTIKVQELKKKLEEAEVQVERYKNQVIQNMQHTKETSMGVLVYKVNGKKKTYYAARLV